MAFYEDEDVRYLHVIIYQVIYGLIVAVGIPLHCITIFILSKGELRKDPVNRYFLLMSVMDLLIMFILIPHIVSLNGCVFYSYSFAFYFAHFGWSLETLFRMISIYIVIWIALDRFLAAYNFSLFQHVYKEGVMTRRMIITVIFCIFSHLHKLIEGNVHCHEGQLEVNCTMYNITDAVRYIASDDMTSKVLSIFHELSLGWLPSILLLVFNVGVAIKLFSKNRGSSNVTSDYRRSKEYKVSITLLCISFTFILCSVPISWYLIYFQDFTDKCYGELGSEFFRGVANVFEISQSLLHFLYLFLLNKKFRMTVLSLFKGVREIREHREASRTRLASSILTSSQLAFLRRVVKNPQGSLPHCASFSSKSQSISTSDTGLST